MGHDLTGGYRRNKLFMPTMDNEESINDGDEGIYFTYAASLYGDISVVIDTVINGSHASVEFMIGEKQTQGFVAENRRPDHVFKNKLSLGALKVVCVFLNEYLSELEKKEKGDGDELC